MLFNLGGTLSSPLPSISGSSLRSLPSLLTFSKVSSTQLYSTCRTGVKHCPSPSSSESLSSDVFAGAGALKCVPANKNQTHPLSSYDFIEQECTELWPVYAKYFPYFLSLQCFLLLALRTNWKRICRDQLGAFLGLAEECKTINVTQCKVKKFLDFQRRSVDILI